MRKIFESFIVLLLCTFVVGCNSSSSVNIRETNNLLDVDSFEKVKEILGFGLNVPEDIFDSSYDRKIYIVNSKIIEVHYTQLDQWIIIRKGLYNDDEDISADYNEYPQIDMKVYNDIKFTFRGNDNKINVACWESEQYSYSVNINPGGIGFDEDAVYQIISQIS